MIVKLMNLYIWFFCGLYFWSERVNKSRDCHLYQVVLMMSFFVIILLIMALTLLFKITNGKIAFVINPYLVIPVFAVLIGGQYLFLKARFKSYLGKYKSLRVQKRMSVLALFISFLPILITITVWQFN